MIYTIMAIAIYFIPTIMAYSNKKVDKASIGALNFFLGWTVIGWVIALVWALKVDKKVI